MVFNGLRHLFWLPCARSHTHLAQHRPKESQGTQKEQRRQWLAEESGAGVLETDLEVQAAQTTSRRV